MTWRRSILVAVAAVAALVLAPTGALAQTAPAPVTIVVNSFSDGGNGSCGDSECTLREAIGVARSVDTVRVPAGNYTINTELISTGDRIVGAGADVTVIGGANLRTRVLTLTGGSTSISGVTLTGGTGVGQIQSGTGGGIYVDTGATLDLADSAIVGNNALSGGGIASAGTLYVTRSAVSGNHAQGVQSDGVVGGIYVMQAAAAEIRNSTVSGNSASATGGGIGTLGRLVLENVTIASNTSTTTATSVGGLVQGMPRAGVDTTLDNTVIARNSGAACGGDANTVAAWNGDHNLDDDGTCGFTATGDRSAVDPLIGNLGYNGGATQTHALAAGSPAIDAGADCAATDQRGAARSGTCDIGAFEFVPPPLNQPSQPLPQDDELPPPVLHEKVNAIPARGTIGSSGRAQSASGSWPPMARSCRSGPRSTHSRVASRSWPPVTGRGAPTRPCSTAASSRSVRRRARSRRRSSRSPRS